MDTNELLDKWGVTLRTRPNEYGYSFTQWFSARELVQAVASSMFSGTTATIDVSDDWDQTHPDWREQPCGICNRHVCKCAEWNLR